MYTNSQMKDKVLGEYKRGGSEKQKGAVQYNKRVIAHENFFNLNYAEAVLKLKQKDQGDCIIRPSSKGTDHLTASWKMHTDIINHVDILERDKPNAYSLGKSLFIDEEVFEDLDEIIANYIEPMASNARDLLNHKNFVETGGCRDSMEALIKKAKKENAQRIPYYVTACGKAAKNPAIEGKFMLSFWPSTKQKIRHEFITATPNGFRYRQIVHNTTANLFKYFKNHYTETPPPAPSQKVRQQNQLASLIKNLNVEQVQKLKKMNEPNPHYTPSDLDNVAHTPSELPFQSRPRVSMSRVGDDKDDFKRPSGFGGRDRDNDSRGGWGGDRRGGGRGGRGGRGDRGGFSENRRQPDRSPDPNRSDKGWGGSSGGGGGWGSNDRDKGRSPPRSRGRNNVWGDDNDDKRGGDRRPRGGGRGRGGRDDFRGGRGRGGRGGRGGGRDGGSWGGNRDRGGRGGGSTPSLSRVHDSPPRGGGSWGNRSPPRMERRQSPPSYSKSPARGGGGGGWGNASPPSGGASGGGWGGSTPRKSPPSSSGWGGGSSSGKATPRKSSPDRSKPSSGGGGWGSPAKSPGPASWGSPAKQPEKEKSKGWGSPNAATAGSQSPGGW